MRTTLCILGFSLLGITAHAQTLGGMMGAMGVASSLQGIGSNAAAIGLNRARNTVNNLNNQSQNSVPTVGSGTATTQPAVASTRPAATGTTRPAATGTTRPAATGTTRPATPQGGNQTGGNQTGGNQTSGGRGGHVAAYVNNGYGRGVPGRGSGSTANMGGRTLPQPLRPVFAVVGTNMRQARLNIRLGFASLTGTPSRGNGQAQQGGRR